MAASEASNLTRSVLFIDSRVPDIQTLTNGANPDELVFILHPGDGVQQISDLIKSHDLSGLASISIVGHGSAGAVELGGTTLNDAVLSGYAPLLSLIGASLAKDGALQIYACDTADGAAGQQFIADLSHYAGGVDVLAATHDVGSADLGGSWTLDASSDPAAGAAEMPFTADALSNYHGTLPSVSTTIDLGFHPGAGVVEAVGDFNKDGTSDILFRDPGTGNVDEWQIIDGHWQASFNFGATHGSLDWKIVGTGDFNADGTSDVLWFNSITGEVDEWQMQAGNWSQSIYFGATHGSLDWQIAGIGDFDGDGDSDVLWLNNKTAQVDEWRMQDGNWNASVVPGPAFGSTDWKVAGIGDFDGDGTSDVLWFNRVTGQVEEWQMKNGQEAKTFDFGATHGSLDWQVASVGDADGDGTSDVLWLNTKTGAMDLWKMADGNWSASLAANPKPPGSEVVGNGTINSDPTDDVLFHDSTGHIIAGPNMNLIDSLSIPADTDGNSNNVIEGAAADTAVGITALASTLSGSAVSYSLTSDTSGGGFKIDSATGVVSVADGSKLDYETATGHAYGITVQAHSNALTTTQSFLIAVSDVAPSAPVDSDVTTNTVAEGSANGSLVGITASSSDINGGALTYSLTSDTSGGGFTIDATTGVISVLDATKIDYETSGAGHSYTVTSQASGGTLISSQSFTIAVTDAAPAAAVDANVADNIVTEGAAAGTAVGITASSTDVNGGTVTYALTGDSSGGGFKIDASTGVITVADASKIDFESSGADHSYTIMVQSSDGVLTNAQTFTIGVSNAAPSMPTDSDTTANNDVLEGAANGTAVGITASSTDVNGGALTYSLIGDTSNGGFTIDATTGVITVADGTKIDYETALGHAYSVTAQASDGILASSQTFSIAVTDVAPSAPVDSDVTTNTVAEGAAAGTAVGITASSSDINGGALTYSLTGDTSNGGFTIDAATGVIAVLDPTKIDYETSGAGHSYTVDAQASDGSLATWQTFTIGVSDVPLTVPVDTDALDNAVRDGAPVGTVVGITAFATDPNGPATTYSLSADSSGGGFKIDSATGVVTVADPDLVDFRSAPDQIYNITVQASNGFEIKTQSFDIVVAAYGLSAPTDVDAADNTVQEGSASGTGTGLQVQSSDPAGAVVTYSLTDDAGGLFAINSNTGLVTVASGAVIDYETAISTDPDSPPHSYNIVVKASSPTMVHGAPLQSSTQFTINISDIAPSTPVDNVPVVDAVFEGAANGTSVGITASSSDPGGGPAPAYSLTDDAGGRFTIDSATGVVSVANGALIDYEAAHSHNITVQATAGALSSSQVFTVNVRDVNDSAPVFSSSATPSVAENTTAVVALTTTDADTVGTNPATFSITGGADQGLFTITGGNQLAFISAPDFETQAHNYDVQVTANDGANQTIQNITVALTDANDNAPMFTSSATPDVVENTTPVVILTTTDADTVGTNPATFSITGGADQGLFTITGGNRLAFIAPRDFETQAHSYAVDVTASDGINTTVQHLTVGLTDANDNAPVFTSSATPVVVENNTAVVDLITTDADTVGTSPPSYSITGGADQGLFTITGGNHLEFISAPDFETQAHSYDVQVTANDGTNQTVQDIAVTLTDANDSAPLFTSSAAPDVVENTTAVVDLTTTDADTVGTSPATFLISGGADQGLFTITGGNQLAFIAPPDFETDAHSYAVDVTASDGINTTVQHLTVGLTDANDNAPLFSSGDAASTPENVAVNVAVYTAMAPDVDGTAANNTVTYTLAAGGDNDLFEIDHASGAVTFKTPPDYEATLDVGGNNVYDISVIASDGDPTHDATQAVAITVTDLNDNAPMFASPTGAAIADEGTPTSMVVFTAFASDGDGTAANNTVTYSLGGADGAQFHIDSSTGEVTFAAVPNFEAPADADGDNFYNINVVASDGVPAHDATQAVTIMVVDLAPGALTDIDPATNQILAGESSGGATGVHAFSTDPATGAVSYALLDNDGVAADAGGRFSIDPSTGIVTVGGTPIAYDSGNPANNDLMITVRASDASGLFSSSDFYIAISPNQPPTIDSDGGGNTFSTSIAENTTAVTTVHATDPDSAPNPAVDYSIVAGDDASKFTIDAASGVLSFVTAPDFEDPTDSSADNSYVVVVRASDGAAFDDQTITVNVTNANEQPQAVADTGNMTEDTASAQFDVIVNDTRDPDSTAANAITIGAAGVTVTGPAGETFADTDAQATIVNNKVQVTLTNASFQQLALGEHATVTVPYVLTGDPGDTSTANLVVTVNGANDAPVAHDDSASATEKGGLNNATGGVNPSGNVITGGGVGDVADTDPDHGDTRTVVAAGTGTEAAPTAAGTVNTAFDGLHGSLLIHTDGSYTYTVNQTDSMVQALHASTDTLTDSFNYTIQDTDGLQDTATLTVTIHGANDLPGAVADTGAMTEDDASAQFDVIVNDTRDPDSTAANAITIGPSAVTVTGPAGETFANTDAQATVVSNKVQVTLTNASFQQLALGEHATVTVPYVLTGDPGDTSTANLVVTVNGANDAPVAHDDSASATEKGGLNNATGGVNPSGNVITGGGVGDVADTDPDHGDTRTVVAAGTGTEAAPTAAGTVNTAFDGLHGSLLIHTDGSYTYTVNQTDSMVQALHASTDTLTDSFNYTIQDTDGLQDTATLTVTIHGANDLPGAVADTGAMTEDDASAQFDVIVNDTRDPDSTAANAITIGPSAVTVTGPAGETFANTDAQATVVSNKVQVTLTTSHFQQLAVGEHATVTVPYTLTGDAGDTSTANLVVTVNGANDVPVAVDDTGTMTEDQSGTAFTVLTGQGADTLDPDHLAPNNVTYDVASHPLVVSGAPTGDGIDENDVSVTVNGSNQIVVNLGSDFQKLQDGDTVHIDVPYTLHGDQVGDTSLATLHVTVNGVNDAPVAADFTFSGVNSANYNTDLVIDGPGAGTPDPTGPQKTISGNILGSATDVDGPGPIVAQAATITTTDGGKVVMLANGDFTYTPKVGTSATTDSFTYTISDQNTGVSGPGTDTGTINLTLQGPHIWYVNSATGSDTTGDGSSEKPFASLALLNGTGNNGATTGDVDSANDIIYLENGTYSGGITLEAGQQLISRSNGLLVGDGSGIAGHNVTLDAAGGSNAVINGSVVLNSGNNIQGVNFGNSAANGYALSGNNVGTVHVNDVTSGTINNSAGGAVSIGGSSNVLNMDFTSITSGTTLNSGISIFGASGTFHGHGGTIANSGNADVEVAAGSLNFTYDGAISDVTGTAVSIHNMTGGTQDFNGAITSGTSGTPNGGGISVANNSNTAVSFDGGMTLYTGSSNAFAATSNTGTSTLTVTGTNHITTTTGTALNISNTTIGASNVTFQDISANGGSNGIVLDTTGTSGGLHVTGNGTTVGASGGGVIQHMTGADGTTNGIGIYLNNTSQVSLNGLQLNDFSNNAVFGLSVGGIKFANSIISGTNGTTTGDLNLKAPIEFGTTAPNVANGFLTGSSSLIDNVNVSGGVQHNVEIYQDAGTFNLTIRNSSIHNNGAALGSDGVNIETTGTSHAIIKVDNTSLYDNKSQAFQASALGSSFMELTFSNNKIYRTNQGNEGVVLQNGASGDLTVAVTNNTFGGTAGGNIPGNNLLVGEVAGNATSASSLNATITGNTITQTGGINRTVIGAPSSTLNSTSQAQANFLFNNNTITTDVGSTALFVSTIDPHTAPNFYATVTNNTVIMTNAASAQAIIVQATQGAPGKGATATVDIHSNDVQRPNGGSSVDIRLRTASPGGGDADPSIRLDPFISASTDPTTVLADDNPASLTQATISPAGSITVVNNVIQLPTTPTTPTLPSFLTAGSGGVQATSPTSGETHLSQDQVNSVVAAAIAQWAHAGASSAQLATLSAITFSVADLAGNTIGDQSPEHITIDTDAAGHGWFVDATPHDSSEFIYTANAAETDLYADPSSAAAGHLDLVTAVAHELGHVLGLPDITSDGNAADLMDGSLVDGERRLPDAVDVGIVNAGEAMQAEAALPTSAQAAADTPIVVGTAGNDVIDAGQGGNILFGGAGADAFVFGPAMAVSAATPPPLTHVADYSAAQGDVFDFSALTTAFHASDISDDLLVRAVEDASGKFATLQLLNPDQSGNAVNIAQLDGAHAGDDVNVIVDSHSAVHLAQIHVGVLV